MKYMKRLAVLVMTALMVAAMTGCEKNEAYTLYNDINKQMDDVTSIEMNMTLQATMELMGQSLDISMDGIVRQIHNSPTDLEQEMIMQLSMMGESATVTSYYKDGYMYQDMMGQKMKLSMSLDEALSQSNASLMAFNDQAIKESSVTDLGGGRSELYFLLDGDVVSESLSSLSESLTASVGAGSGDLFFGDVAYRITSDKDKSMEGMQMDFPMTIAIEGIPVTMDFSMTTQVISFNTIDQISYPADLDSYPG